MIREGDLVRVIGKTSCGDDDEVECIKIGTVCEVISVDPDTEGGYCEVRGKWAETGEYWYKTSALEKGNMIWVPDDNG